MPMATNQEGLGQIFDVISAFIEQLFDMILGFIQSLLNMELGGEEEE